MIYGCIDIGSNTTRLLVADSADGGLRELAARRAFTRIGRSLSRDGRIPEEKIRETAAVAGAQARLARELGAAEIAGVATAAIREAPNRFELGAAVRASAGIELRVLAGSEEARLSFLGATRTLAEPAEGSIAVVDVGGGSTEVAVGSPDGAVDWWQSVPVGSGLLADAHLHSDPPAEHELQAARDHVAGLFEGVTPPGANSAVAVGGTATSLHRMVGAALDHTSLDDGVRTLCEAPIAAVAQRYGLDPERVRLLPAGILVLSAVSQCLGLPLCIASGGLREGVILELMNGREPERG